MKNKFNIYLIAILSLFMFSSCEDYVDVDIPGQEKKLVAYCFLSPQDTVLRVYVYHSTPLYGSLNNYMQNTSISNATVSLSDGTNSIIVPFDYDEGKYKIDASAFPIAEGTTYFLTVESDGYPTINSQTTVPAHTPHFISTSLTELSSNSGFEYSNEYRFETKWDDAPNEENYYSINAISQLISHNEMTYYEDFDAGKYNFTDNGSDGNTLSLNTTLYTYHMAPIEGGDIERNFVIYLLNVTKDYYLFHRSIEYISSGDPFSEPTITYTNMQNGLGCFASFNGSFVTIPY